MRIPDWKRASSTAFYFLNLRVLRVFVVIALKV